MIFFPLADGPALILLPLLFNRGERRVRRRPLAPVLVLGVLVALAALTQPGYEAPGHHTSMPNRSLPTSSEQPTGQSTMARLFNRKGCPYCHRSAGHGGRRGPDLSTITDRLRRRKLIIRIMNGAHNMPAVAGILTPEELDNLLAFRATPSASGSPPLTPAHDTTGLP